MGHGIGYDRKRHTAGGGLWIGIKVHIKNGGQDGIR